MTYTQPLPPLLFLIAGVGVVHCWRRTKGPKPTLLAIAVLYFSSPGRRSDGSFCEYSRHPTPPRQLPPCHSGIGCTAGFDTVELPLAVNSHCSN
jgi:hypothetical protein